MKWIRGAVLLIAICPLMSCQLFKSSLRDEAFCSSAAFVDTSKLKPQAPKSNSDDEFHTVAGTNVANQHRVITAYDNLRECWDHWNQK